MTFFGHNDPDDRNDFTLTNPTTNVDLIYTQSFVANTSDAYRTSLLSTKDREVYAAMRLFGACLSNSHNNKLCKQTKPLLF